MNEAFDEAVAAALAELHKHPNAEGLKVVVTYSFPAIEHGQRNASVVMSGGTDMQEAADLMAAGAMITRVAAASTEPVGLCMCAKCVAQRKREAH